MTDVTGADLQRVPLFAGLPEDELASLAETASRRRLADGDVLFEQGQPARSLHVVVSGSVLLRAGRERNSVIVENLGPGDLVGWSAMRENAITLSTGHAAGAAEVIVIPVEPIIALVTSGSAGSRRLFQRIVGLAAGHLEAAWGQLLQVGREGPITGG